MSHYSVPAYVPQFSVIICKLRIYALSEFNTRDYTKIIGTEISITCGASKLTTFAITEDRVKWVTEGRSLMTTI